MNQTAMPMACPKCKAAMHTYERNGVVIDQCTECRVIFLDRGEFDRLIAAEESAYGSRANNAQYQGQSAYDDGRGSGHGDSKYGSKSGKRRGGFLGELFD
ncbi:MAG: zf-TFIIB domain-containing protein [Candidatus Nanopelagicales bacterium]|nr:zf-TFIIB domain-containing protein [Candidatus Nanopelagicales bacterium]